MAKTTTKIDKHLRRCACGAQFRTKPKGGRPFEKCPACRAPGRDKKRAA